MKKNEANCSYCGTQQYPEESFPEPSVPRSCSASGWYIRGRGSVSELGGTLEPVCGRREEVSVSLQGWPDLAVCKHRGWAIRPLDLTLKAHRKQPKVSEQMRQTSFASGKD